MVVVVAVELFAVAPLCCQRSAFTGDATRCAGELGCAALLRPSSTNGSAAGLAACATVACMHRFAWLQWHSAVLFLSMLLVEDLLCPNQGCM